MSRPDYDPAVSRLPEDGDEVLVRAEHGEVLAIRSACGEAIELAAVVEHK